jgi:hypothetical protein
MFGLVRKKWYQVGGDRELALVCCPQGEGVCTEKEVVDEGEVEERNGFGIFRMNMRSTHCHDEAELHECRTDVTEGGLRRTIVERKVCCHGHRREPGTLGCSAVSLQAVEDTMRGLGGSVSQLASALNPSPGVPWSNGGAQPHGFAHKGDALIPLSPHTPFPDRT